MVWALLQIVLLVVWETVPTLPAWLVFSPSIVMAVTLLVAFVVLTAAKR